MREKEQIVFYTTIPDGYKKIDFRKPRQGDIICMDGRVYEEVDLYSHTRLYPQVIVEKVDESNPIFNETTMDYKYLVLRHPDNKNMYWNLSEKQWQFMGDNGDIDNEDMLLHSQHEYIVSLLPIEGDLIRVPQTNGEPDFSSFTLQNSKYVILRHKNDYDDRSKQPFLGWSKENGWSYFHSSTELTIFNHEERCLFDKIPMEGFYVQLETDGSLPKQYK